MKAAARFKLNFEVKFISTLKYSFDNLFLNFFASYAERYAEWNETELRLTEKLIRGNIF